MENDWNRFDTKDVCNSVLAYTLSSELNYFAWFTQANYIFSRLQITSNVEDYVLVDQVMFQIKIGNTTEPPGYLFLCPTTDFQTRPSSFRWPECPAYWSLDPSGVERLSTEEATQLGFPSFQLTTRICGKFWDTSVYAGLCQFHQAKGFDPDSQDVARHLGKPLYLLSQEVDSLFAHMEEDWSDDGTDEGETDDEWEDAQSSVEVEDGDESIQNSDDANEEEGLLNVCTEPHKQNTAEARQEPTCSTDQDPNPAELRVPSAGIILFVANIVLSCYSLLALVFSLLTYFHTLKNARILLVANTPELALSTLAAAFALFHPAEQPPFRAVYTFLLWIAFGLLVVPEYIAYKHRPPNLEAKVNQQWSQELSAAGCLTIQSVLGCCGYFSPFVEATVSATCYSRSILPGCKQQFLEFQEKALTRWYIVGFGLVLVHIAIMAAGLLCSNYVTYRFGKMMSLLFIFFLTLYFILTAGWADQYGADAAAHMISNNSGNTGSHAQTHTRGTGSGLSGLGSGSGGQ
ncbi:hypothetical protein B0H16DRAFT_1900719 [Mycena metata]|uniref:Uncharacterized protein n=1 Tax=Mycena metata TaxID=1033252 RepID=A0AAD7H3Q0_9AGAR|nr:hypothetical protein B0H16DRAFT_1900719 [Mycena metata]